MGTLLGNVKGVLFAGFWALVLGSACGKNVSQTSEISALSPSDEIQKAFEEGQPKRALRLLKTFGEGRAEDQELEVLALVQTQKWEAANRLGEKLSPQAKSWYACLSAVSLREINAPRLCRELPYGENPSLLYDFAKQAEFRAYEIAQAKDKAMEEWKAFLERRGSLVNRQAYLDFLERQGMLQIAIFELERWLQADAAHLSVWKERLLSILEKKINGDWEASRLDEGLTSTKLHLKWAEDDLKYHYILADFLEQKGDFEAAKQERAMAEKAGVPPFRLKPKDMPF